VCKYLLFVPDGYDGTTPVPLVLNFHGSGSNPDAQLAYSNFVELAEEKGSVTALPLGQYNFRGLNSWNTINDPDDVDDVQFTRDIINDLTRRLSIALTSPWSGKTSKDITASQLIWEFVMAHPLP